MKKRILSVFLIVCLCAALLPTAALAATFGEGWTELNSYCAASSEPIQLPEGKYYLSGDLTLEERQSIQIVGDVTIDLNGHVLRGVTNDFIKIFSGGHLILQDSDSYTHSHLLTFQSGEKTVTGGAVLTSVSPEVAPCLDCHVISLSCEKNSSASLTLKGGTICGYITMSVSGSNSSGIFYADGGTVLGEVTLNGNNCKITRSNEATDYTTFTYEVRDSSGNRVENAAKIPVMFDADGGTFDNSAESVVLHIFKGQKLGKPDSDPTKAGYTFGGWYTDAADPKTAWNGDTVVTAPMTFTAKWEEEIPPEENPDENPDEQPDENPDNVGGLVAILDNVPFVDVSFNDYFYDSVKWAYHSGVTGGTDAWHFSPDAGCTRAQAVTFLWRAAGCPTASYLGNFTDVDADAYYAPAVAWAVANGVTNGTSATTFSPNAPCSRGDIVTFLYRAFGGTSNGYHPFTDVAASAYYADAVAWAYEHNVTGGTSADKFSPADACSRAQIVTFLYRTLG